MVARRKVALELIIPTGKPPVWFQLSAAVTSTRPARSRIGYTGVMTSEEIERIETKIAFLESANVELSDVVYRQQQEIAALRARLDALAQRLEVAQTPYTPRTPEEERPPHY
jgi:uncharacterized coiled-coil protein SlyX